MSVCVNKIITIDKLMYFPLGGGAPYLEWAQGPGPR